MIMTAEEIVRDYRQAANKQRQIGILADRNCVSPGEIREVLAQEGVEGVKMPKRIRHRAPKTQEAVQTPAAAPSEPAIPVPVPSLPSIYAQIERIFDALPEQMDEDALITASELIDTIFSRYIIERLEKKSSPT